VSAGPPSYPAPPVDPDIGNPGLPEYVIWTAPPPRPKFQHNYTRHLVLFALTFVTTTWVWSFGFMWMALGSGISPLAAFTWETFISGLSYSIPLLTILSAHEFGHSFACRYYNVDATLPYYLPAPLPPAGTFGAVIRIREPFPSKRALFDIGIAGPIAGFVALLPFLFWGLSLSTVDTIPPEGGLLYFGEPLLFKLLERAFFGVLEDGQDVILHPIGLAAWWGMLATALNLLPFGQLDGGHIIYAALGRHAARLSVATLAVVILLTLLSPSWMLLAVLLVVVSFTFGFRHPRVPDEDAPLDRRRVWLTILAFAIFALCFMPEPISITGGS
jgi:membrane-associated protease RseP (regulator of RpoE activity)